MKNRPVAVELCSVWADGWIDGRQKDKRKDRHDEASSRCSQFCERALKTGEWGPLPRTMTSNDVCVRVCVLACLEGTLVSEK
jgi:hypothetical protein